MIEMIAVLVIIGIVIAIGIPAMSGLTRSAGVQGGVRQFSNTAELARQFAITHRIQTEVRTTTNAVGVFINGTQVGKWDNLPGGVIIIPVAPAPLNFFFKPTGGLVSAVDLTFVVREGVTNGTSLVGLNSNVSTIVISSILGRVAIQ